MQQHWPTDPTPPRKLLPPYPWWNAAHDKLIRMHKAALWQFQYRGTRENFINYKKAEAKARNELKKTKRESFINFTKSLTRFTNPLYV
jgi:hypothetical protein